MKIDASVLTREYLNKRLDEIDAELRKRSCADNSCAVIRPRGMATNGGCRCFDKHLQFDREQIHNAKVIVQLYRQKTEYLEELCKLK